MKRLFWAAWVTGMMCGVPSCAPTVHIAVDKPIEIHATVDVRIRVEREAEQLLSFEDKYTAGGVNTPTTAPVR